MRQIKFRAWSELHKTMYYTNKEQTVWAGGLGFSVNTDEKQITNVTIGMQFTGLKDKNRKDIYEGDIVLRATTNLTVCWSENDCAFDLVFPGGYEDLLSTFIDDGLKKDKRLTGTAPKALTTKP